MVLLHEILMCKSALIAAFLKGLITLRLHLFNTYAKFSEKHICVRVRGVGGSNCGEGCLAHCRHFSHFKFQ